MWKGRRFNMRTFTIASVALTAALVAPAPLLAAQGPGWSVSVVVGRPPVVVAPAVVVQRPVVVAPPVVVGPPVVRRSNFAFDTGYRDGYAEGLNDGRARHRNDPYGESRWRNGDHDYNRAVGSRQFYRVNYRQGFENGYSRGYNEGWRWRR
jgi:hypothetical protein